MAYDESASILRLHHAEHWPVGTMATELGRILDYAAKLQEVEVEGVPPMTHPVPVPCPLRADVIGEHFSPATAIGNAPKTSEGHFAVPAILSARGNG